MDLWWTQQPSTAPLDTELALHHSLSVQGLEEQVQQVRWVIFVATKCCVGVRNSVQDCRASILKNLMQIEAVILRWREGAWLSSVPILPTFSHEALVQILEPGWNLCSRQSEPRGSGPLSDSTDHDTLLDRHWQDCQCDGARLLTLVVFSSLRWLSRTLVMEGNLGEKSWDLLRVLGMALKFYALKTFGQMSN